MNLNDLLANHGIDPKEVLVFRHRPSEPELNRVLPWLAAEKPDVFNAYQQTHGLKVQNAMQTARYIASFIGHQPGKAVFIGLYSIGDHRTLTFDQYWQIPAYREMKELGMKGWADPGERASILWFDLTLTPWYSDWKGKLTVSWPPPERSWWRWANRNTIPVVSILEESALDAAMPEWDRLVLTWEQLKLIPARWKAALSQWRGLYYIFDVSDGKGYVGAAYGKDNLYGRWLEYSRSGHGGNARLRPRDPRNLRFSILQRLSPDLDAEDVIRIEAAWKERLHTRHPHGLNEN